MAWRDIARTIADKIDKQTIEIKRNTERTFSQYATREIVKRDLIKDLIDNGVGMRIAQAAERLADETAKRVEEEGGDWTILEPFVFIDSARVEDGKICRSHAEFIKSVAGRADRDELALRLTAKKLAEIAKAAIAEGKDAKIIKEQIDAIATTELGTVELIAVRQTPRRDRIDGEVIVYRRAI